MPTATEADAASRCVIERKTERSDFQLVNRLKRSRCAGPFQALERYIALDIVGSYHQSIHRSLGRPPTAVWRDHEGDIPSMEFYEATELNGNMDNWNGPTVGCVLAMCAAQLRFASVTQAQRQKSRRKGRVPLDMTSWFSLPESR